MRTVCPLATCGPVREPAIKWRGLSPTQGLIRIYDLMKIKNAQFGAGNGHFHSGAGMKGESHLGGPRTRTEALCCPQSLPQTKRRLSFLNLKKKFFLKQTHMSAQAVESSSVWAESSSHFLFPVDRAWLKD